jgi:protein SCO1
MRSSVPVCLLSVFFCISLSGCGSSDKHYTLIGRLVSKVPATRTIVVDHNEIPHFMAAMTMPYLVADCVDLSGIEPGDQIRADIDVKPDGQYSLDRISVTDSSHREKAPKEAKQLWPGQDIPDIELVNQDGQTVRLSEFRGRTMLLTFIYTRCPMPNFCPRLSSLFASVNRELAKNPKEYERTQLLSVSIDPKYDTPPVLRKYGLAYLNEDPKGFAHWQFTAPSLENLRRLADAFSLIYEEEDNQISHTMSTVLIGPDGKLAKTWIMSDWTAAEAMTAIQKMENASH